MQVNADGLLMRGVAAALRLVVFLAAIVGSVSGFVSCPPPSFIVPIRLSTGGTSTAAPGRYVEWPQRRASMYRFDPLGPAIPYRTPGGLAPQLHPNEARISTRRRSKLLSLLFITLKSSVE